MEGNAAQQRREERKNPSTVPNQRATQVMQDTLIYSTAMYTLRKAVVDQTRISPNPSSGRISASQLVLQRIYGSPKLLLEGSDGGCIDVNCKYCTDLTGNMDATCPKTVLGLGNVLCCSSAVWGVLRGLKLFGSEGRAAGRVAKGSCPQNNALPAKHDNFRSSRDQRARCRIRG
jgi:hypothetical protein